MHSGLRFLGISFGKGLVPVMFRELRERETLAQEFLEMKQDSESVIEITRMFTEREMFCPEFASEQAQTSRYLSMLNMDIRQFVSTQRCETLLELQEATRQRELEIEVQLHE